MIDRLITVCSINGILRRSKSFSEKYQRDSRLIEIIFHICIQSTFPKRRRGWFCLRLREKTVTKDWLRRRRGTSNETRGCYVDWTRSYSDHCSTTGVCGWKVLEDRTDPRSREGHSHLLPCPPTSGCLFRTVFECKRPRTCYKRSKVAPLCSVHRYPDGVWVRYSLGPFIREFGLFGSIGYRYTLFFE